MNAYVMIRLPFVRLNAMSRLGDTAGGSLILDRKQNRIVQDVLVDLGTHKGTEWRLEVRR